MRPRRSRLLFGYLERRRTSAALQHRADPADRGGAHDARCPPLFALVRWGLIPSFATDPKKFGLLINARADSITTRGAVKHAMRYRRCLVPASASTNGTRTPRRGGPTWCGRSTAARSRSPGCGKAGWARTARSWRPRPSSPPTRTRRCIRSTHRMPVVIPPEAFDFWLDCRNVDAELGGGACWCRRRRICSRPMRFRRRSTA